MRKNKIFLLFPLLFIYLLFIQALLNATLAEWSILVYMQADNNLFEFADKDMAAMVNGYQFTVVDSNFLVNTLVQVDYPQDKKTWRFKIDQAGKIEHDSLNQQMGVHPADELVASARWIKEKYPAKQYAIILWGHGTGEEDLSSKGINSAGLNNIKKFNSIWMDVFDTYTCSCKIVENIEKTGSAKSCDERGLGDLVKNGRGILYDDSEKTCLTNQGLTIAFSQIKSVLGQKIDLVGMDACLMAMVEVAYQIKDYVNVLVASQDTEPGLGWDYADILRPLVSNPGLFTSDVLARSIVASYGSYYSPTDTHKYTLSAVNLNLLDPLCANIGAISLNILECLKYESFAIKKAVHMARLNSKSFAMPCYIDLYSFYHALHAEITQLRHNAEVEHSKCCGFLHKQSPNYIPTLDHLIEILNEGIGILGHVVFANVDGSADIGSNGISIFYPISASGIHPSYANTLFAQHTNWLNVLKLA
jgi:hypothetical protein